MANAPFIRRALVFLDAARRGRYPNARWLAEQDETSVPTARRTITYLRDEYLAPLSYSDAHRGWQLVDPTWTFPPGALAERRELLALAVALGAGRAVADPDLDEALETLSLRVADRLQRSRVDLEALLDAFSIERTDRAVPADAVVLDTIEAVAKRRVVSFEYRSPWRDGRPEMRTVRPLHVRVVDGSAYLLGACDDGERVFNLAAVHKLAVRDDVFDPPSDTAERDWAASFGVWAGPGATLVRVRIGPPAARFFARQRWHIAQADSWEGDVLVRELTAHPSPELLRRLAAVGPDLLDVEPDAVRRALLERASAVLLRLGTTAPR